MQPARRAGGFGTTEPDDLIQLVDMGSDFVPPRLPISSSLARTWIALHETRMKPLPDKTPLGQVIQAIKEATRGKDGKEPPVEFVIHPIGLLEAEITMQTPVDLPIVGREELFLDAYLTLVVRQFGLSHWVHSGVVVISLACDDCPGYQTVAAQEARTWLVLNEVVPLKYPDGVPLRTLLETIHRTTAGKGKDARGLVIHVDQLGLKEAEQTMTSKVTIDLERAPLCTALRRLLGPIGLQFHVRDDGILIIKSRGSDVDCEMDESDLIEGYRMSRYDGFHQRRNELRQELDRQLRGPGGMRKGMGTPPAGGGMRSIRPAGPRVRSRKDRLGPRPAQLSPIDEGALQAVPEVTSREPEPNRE